MGKYINSLSFKGRIFEAVLSSYLQKGGAIYCRADRGTKPSGIQKLERKRSTFPEKMIFVSNP